MERYGQYVDHYNPPKLPAERGASALAWATLGLGVGSWLALPFVGAMAAMCCGFVERRKIAEGTSSPRGKQLVSLGLILGGVQLLVLALLFAGGFLFSVMMTLSALVS